MVWGLAAGSEGLSSSGISRTNEGSKERNWQRPVNGIQAKLEFDTKLIGSWPRLCALAEIRVQMGVGIAVRSGMPGAGVQETITT